MIAQTLDSGIEELDRQEEEQAADQRYPGPNISRDKEGKRQG